MSIVYRYSIVFVNRKELLPVAADATSVTLKNRVCRLQGC